METVSTLPTEIIVDPGGDDPFSKRVMVTSELSHALRRPNVLFREADRNYAVDRKGYLQAMEDSVFSFRSSTGADIDCSLIPGKGSEALVVWAPFSDCAPRSRADDIYRYVTQREESPTLRDKVKAAPNSWNQLTKSAVVSDFLETVGHEMPVLTIFSPLPSVPYNAYSRAENKHIRRGDFSPAGRLALEALRAAQDRLHGPHSETQLETIHAHGASLGASSAIGSAHALMRMPEYQISSVTAQELIVAPKRVIGDLALRFTVKGSVGEVSDWNKHRYHHTPLYEPLIRREIDSGGNEPAMILRMLQGMSKLSRLKGLTRPERNCTPAQIEDLAEAGVSVAIPLAANSGLTHDTPGWLPGAGERIITVRASRGERIAHLIDEHVGATALLAAMHVANSSRHTG
jgi:hypothetical protein